MSEWSKAALPLRCRRFREILARRYTLPNREWPRRKADDFSSGAIAVKRCALSLNPLHLAGDLDFKRGMFGAHRVWNELSLIIFKSCDIL